MRPCSRCHDRGPTFAAECKDAEDSPVTKDCELITCLTPPWSLHRIVVGLGSDVHSALVSLIRCSLHRSTLGVGLHHASILRSTFESTEF